MYGPAMTSSKRQRAVATSTVLTLASAAAVLPRMRREFDDVGRLSLPTVAWMYSTYAAHAGTTTAALTRNEAPRRRAASRLARGLGYGLASAGAFLSIAGMSRFAGPAHISGMNDEQLAATGVYRWSRNPQYVGYVAFLTGLAAARLSLPAAALAAAAAGAFAWWVPAEERHLEQAYGESYWQYTKQVPRWLPVPAAA